MSVALTAVLTSPPAITAHNQAVDCAVFIEDSGSGTDNPDNRRWLLDQSEAVADVYRPISSGGMLTVGIFDEDVQIIGEVSEITNDVSLRDSVDSSFRSKRWTDPLVVLESALRLDSIDCVIIVTDGSLDLPPQLAIDPAGHMSRVFALADTLREHRVPVSTIALHDETVLWDELARRTGGLYLVNPDRSTLESRLADVFQAPAQPAPPASPTPSPTVTPSPERSNSPAPSPTTLASPAPPSDRGSSPGMSPALMGLAVSSIAVPIAALLVLLMAVRRNRPRLTGNLEIYEPEEEDHVRRSDRL